MSENYTFDDFLASVDTENREFLSELHYELTKRGCKIVVNLAKSGYVVSYNLNKKTIANYVFRKKGIGGPHLCKPYCSVYGYFRYTAR